MYTDLRTSVDEFGKNIQLYGVDEILDSMPWWILIRSLKPDYAFY